MPCRSCGSEPTRFRSKRKRLRITSSAMILIFSLYWLHLLMNVLDAPGGAQHTNSDFTRALVGTGQQRDVNDNAMPSALVNTSSAKSNPDSGIDLGQVESERDPFLFDIVTFVHHDDLSVFVDYGLASWFQHFAVAGTRVYVVCTEQAQSKINAWKGTAEGTGSSSVDWNRIVLVPERIYPFSLEMVGLHTWGNKPTWIYQQLLKVYTYPTLAVYTPAVRRRFLILDSDTVALQPHAFLQNGTSNPVFNVASSTSGTFENDCLLQPGLLAELFPDGSVPVALPEFSGMRFTAITHHMMMDGTIWNEIIEKIEKLHQKSAWKVLSSLKDSVLSEWEIYFAWMMQFHRSSVVLKQTAFMNSGRVDDELLQVLHRGHPDVVYVSKHDDYEPESICCVNSAWPFLPAAANNHPPCPCCSPRENCRPTNINCKFLGIPDCRETPDAVLSFSAASA